MTPQEALVALDRLTAEIVLLSRGTGLTRSEHVNVQTAIRVLGERLNEASKLEKQVNESEPTT